MTQVYGKFDDDNTDLEIEGAAFFEEFDQGVTKKYFRRSFVVLTKITR